jgi:iron complex transport system permease protein
MAPAATQARLRPRAWFRLPIFAAMLFGVCFAFLLTLAFGSVRIPLPDVVRILLGQEARTASWEVIVLDLRLPRAITATLAGAALGVAGLQLQTLFRNALADPFVLGISSGASLGVALVILPASGVAGRLLIGFGLLQNLSVVAAAALGSAAVMALMFAIAARVRNAVIVLITGVMIGAFVSAIVNTLIFFAHPEAVKAFTDWHLGSFQGVGWRHMPVFLPAILAGVGLAVFAVKGLNAYLLGEQYAESMGVSVRGLRLLTLTSASILAGTVTAFAGPIAFLGIAAPHLARGLLRTADHRLLLPGSVLIGMLIALTAGLFAELPGSTLVLPLNSALALIGAPVVLWVLLRMTRTATGLEL